MMGTMQYFFLVKFQLIQQMKRKENKEKLYELIIIQIANLVVIYITKKISAQILFYVLSLVLF